MRAAGAARTRRNNGTGTSRGRGKIDRFLSSPHRPNSVAPKELFLLLFFAILRLLFLAELFLFIYRFFSFSSFARGMLPIDIFLSFFFSHRFSFTFFL